MDKEIKERIAAINSGVIPEGYKKTKVGTVPVEWEQRALGNLVKIGDIDHRMPATVEKGIPYLMTGDFCGTTELNFNGVKQISKEDYELLSRKIKPEYGDIIFARYASVGAVRYIDFSKEFLISYSCAIIKKGDKIDSKYLYHFFTSDLAQKQIILEINNSSQANIGIDSMKKNIHVPFPSRLEQVKITEILSTQDKLIELQEKKIEQLKELKKAYLQKMFPQKGSKYPELRFKGFTDPWEQRKLGECMETVTDYVAAGSFADIADHVQYKNSPDYAQLIRTVDLKHEFRNSDYVYVDKKAFDYLWRVNLNEECIILPNIGANIGEVYYIAPFSLPYKYNVLGPNAILLKTKDSTKFMFTLLQADDFQNKLFVSIASSGQPKFNKTELKAIKVLMPSPDEQDKIGQYFSQLDSLITLHQRKLEQEKQKKKALMQLLLTGIVRTK